MITFTFDIHCLVYHGNSFLFYHEKKAEENHDHDINWVNGEVINKFKWIQNDHDVEGGGGK